MQDNQLQYLIQLCRAKDIPEEEITKILSENSKSEFIKELEASFRESQVYSNIPQKWKQYSKKYVEYIGTLMDPSKIYTSVKDEPSMPNPQVKKKEELKFKKELLNYVLIIKNRALKKYLSVI
jgi:cobalamin biosynthesis protein CbiD